MARGVLAGCAVEGFSGMDMCVCMVWHAHMVEGAWNGARV